MKFETALSQCPIVAILWGITPQEAAAIGEALISAGITILEVPLNSPEPFESIRILAEVSADRALVGAGTVLKAPAVRSVADAGGQIIVTSNLNLNVGTAATAAGLYWTPGVVTPTEAFAALDAGCDAIKLFPAELISPKIVKAMRAVLPATARVLVVGGVTVENIPAYVESGVNGFGIGSSLYSPGDLADKVKNYAQRLVSTTKHI